MSIDARMGDSLELVPEYAAALKARAWTCACFSSTQKTIR